MPSERSVNGDDPVPGGRYALGSSIDEAGVTSNSTALMIIDMQYLDAHRDFGISLKRRQQGSTEDVEYYFSRLETTVVPNTQRLLHACREAGIPVIHVRVMNLAADSSDTSRRYKAKGMLVPPGSKDAQILEELAPLDDEIVLSKTTSNVFVSTNADFLLRNMGIDTLIITGVTTNSCVESSTRGAGDLGYQVLLVEDACATWTQEIHAASLRNLDGNFAIVKSTEQILAEVASVGVAHAAAR